MAGLIAFGIATIRARVLPSYAGLGLVLLEPASILTWLAFAPFVGLSDLGAYSSTLPQGGRAVPRRPWTTVPRRSGRRQSPSDQVTTSRPASIPTSVPSSAQALRKR